MEPVVTFALFVAGASGFALFMAARAAYTWYFSGDVTTRRALKRVQRMAIGAVGDGDVVKISGVVACAEGEEPLEAPLSGRPCVAWQVVVERLLRGFKKTEWCEIIRDQGAQRFLVDDGTGRAIVEARRPELSLRRDRHYRSGIFKDPAPKLRSFLARHGRTAADHTLVDNATRFHEGVVVAGERVSVYGLARREPDPCGDGSYRKAATLVVLLDPVDGQVLLSDDESTAK